jgi:hypothetical protein
MSNNVIKITKIETKEVRERENGGYSTKIAENVIVEGYVTEFFEYKEIGDILRALVLVEEKANKINIKYNFEKCDIDRLNFENFNRRVNGEKEMTVCHIFRLIKLHAMKLSKNKDVSVEIKQEFIKMSEADNVYRMHEYAKNILKLLSIRKM